MEIDMTYGEDTIDDIAEMMLIGLGCNTEANQDFLVARLEELVSYVTELCAEKALKMGLSKKSGPPEGDVGTI